ncbi:MAG: MFS transporter [Candidatus Pristimantibacillus lignocellulolyticus]|uniref:MFS transporter n=1 Tax=Candidatus Pristimantibacillus lignocellulolyticus TaxID=2994561 RepID=A0A9J6ZJG4_9BACL|nr:MAG: MFS transporter [Candidatus Pristimantibacillus lignocellulolyticus]
MNIKVIALTIAAFVVGLVELIIGGILPQISEDLNVSISSAGLLITVFSLVFAIAGPLLLSATSKIERKKLLLISLTIFFVGTMIAFLAPNYFILLIARIVNAASGSLVIVLALTLSIKVVSENYRARAIGFVSMGISSSIVIGIPVGVLISDFWSWRIIFLIASILTVIAFFIIVLFIEKVPGGKVITIREQFLAIKQIKIASGHLMMMFAIGGHYLFYAYLTPYVQQYYGLNASQVSMIYFVFGFSAIAGGFLGGILSDKINPRRAVVTIVATFLVTLLLISLTRDNFYLFIPLLIIWGIMSWAVSPPQQAYLIQTSPKTGDIQQSIHNSALQFGIAGGSALGGFLIDFTDDVTTNSWAACFVMAIALGLAIFSTTRPVPQDNNA